MLFFGKKSIYPLILNSIIDILILNIKKKPGLFSQQSIYASEFYYRVGRLSIYLLREPIYSVITKPFIQKLLRIIRIPASIINIIIDLLTYYTNFYFIL